MSSPPKKKPRVEEKPHTVKWTPTHTKIKKTKPYDSPSAILDRNMEQSEFVFKRIFGTRGATYVSSGSFGSIYEMRLTDKMKTAFLKSKFDAVQVSPSFHTVHEPVYIKLIHISTRKESHQDVTAYGARSAAREIAAHWSMSESPAITIGDKRYDIASVVPHVHAIALDRYGKIAIIIMQKIHGETLTNYMHNHPTLDPWVLYKFEYALACLWLSGYIHGDLHSGNVMIDTKHKKVYIIDFGHVIQLPKDVVEASKDALKYDKGLDVIWESIRRYGNVAVMQRYHNHASDEENPAQTQWFRNGNLMRAVRSQTALSNTQLKAGRRDAWGLWK